MQRPIGEPKPSDFEIAERELGEAGEGRLLVRKRFMSVEPYMRGFIVSDHGDREAAFREEVGDLVTSGRLVLAESIVEGGIEAAVPAFVDMLRGAHVGKVVVRL